MRTSSPVVSSHISSIYTLLAALKAAEAILGGKRTWKPIDQASVARSRQDYFLLRFLPLLEELVKIPELQALASFDHEALNRFMREQGFSLRRFSSFSAERYGVASILKLPLEWVRRAERVSIRAHNSTEQYPGIAFSTEDVEIYRARTNHLHQHPIARISTSDPATVAFVTLWDYSVDPSDPFRLIEMAEELMSVAQRKERNEFAGLHLPMVNLVSRPSLSWLEGLKTTASDGCSAEIAQALQGVELKVNQQGFMLQDEVKLDLITARVEAPKPLFIIDRPFLFWVTRRGLSAPLLSAYVNYDSMQDPGTLTF